MGLLTTRLDTFLHRHPELKTVLIWGQGELGDMYRQHLAIHHPALFILGMVDSHHKGAYEQKKNCRLYGPHDITELSPDLVIVASVSFETEILAVARKMQQGSHFSLFSPSLEGGPGKDEDRRIDAEEESYSERAVFEAPENSRVWYELAEGLSGKEKEDVLVCAKWLDDQLPLNGK